MPIDTYTETTSTGAGPYPYNFTVLKPEFLIVEVDGVVKSLTTHYTVGVNGVTFTDGNHPASNTVVTIKRDSQAETALVEFVNTSTITESSLDLSYDHNLHLGQELFDLVGRCVSKIWDGVTNAFKWDFKGYHAKNVGGITLTDDLNMGGNVITNTGSVDNLTLVSGATGATGPDGADGSDGVNARAVNLSIADQTFEYNTNGATPSPVNAIVTGSAVNTTGTVYYEFIKNDTSVQNTTATTYAYTPPASYSDMPEKLEVQIREGTDDGNILARDQISVLGLKAGTDAITLVVSNESHTLPKSKDGVITYTGSGTTIEVWEGTTQISYDDSNPYNSPSFRITPSATNITVGSGSIVGNSRKFADHSSMTNTNASIAYSIVVKNSSGIETTFVKTQSFGQSVEGSDGSTGPAGTDGATWLSGTDTPASGLGTDGDFYLDTDDNKIYKKASGSWSEIADISAGTWGTIDGTLTNQTDLNTALDAKADSSHTHPYDVEIVDESSSLTTTVDKITFTGDGVVATNPTGENVTVTIDGVPLTVQEEGTNVSTSTSKLNFVGTGITATASGSDATVTVSPTAGAGSNQWVFLSTPYEIWAQSSISGSATSTVTVAGGSTGVPSCPRYILFKVSCAQGQLSYWNAPGLKGDGASLVDAYSGTHLFGEWVQVFEGINNWGFEFLFILPYIQLPIDYGDHATSASAGKAALTNADKVPDSTSHSNLIGLNKMKFAVTDLDYGGGTADVNLDILAYIA